MKSSYSDFIVCVMQLFLFVLRAVKAAAAAAAAAAVFWRSYVEQ